LGGGVEHRLEADWSLSLEYLHYEFDGIVATGAAITPPGAFPRFENDIDVRRGSRRREMAALGRVRFGSCTTNVSSGPEANVSL